MALDANALANILQGVLTTQVEIPTIDQNGRQDGTRIVVAAPDSAVILAFSTALIDYLKSNIEVVIPNLPVEVAGTLNGTGNVSGSTGSGGDPSHSHSFSDGFSTTVPISINTIADASAVRGTIE